MLLVLGISCKVRAVALFEDINIEEESQANNHTIYTGYTLRPENVDKGYNNAAW